jgi:hypothetical protein
MAACTDCGIDHENPFSDLTHEEVYSLGDKILLPVLSVPNMGTMEIEGQGEAFVFLKLYGTDVSAGERFVHQYAFDPVAALRVATHLLTAATNVLNDPEEIVNGSGEPKPPVKEASTGLYL